MFKASQDGRAAYCASSRVPPPCGGVKKRLHVSLGMDWDSEDIGRKVCDGVDERKFGYGWFDRSLLHANGNKTAFVGEQVRLAELFPNGLTNSEAFWL